MTAHDAGIADTDRGEQRVLAQEWVPADRAAVCLDCHTVFRIQAACPRCASRAWMLFTTIARRHE